MNGGEMTREELSVTLKEYFNTRIMSLERAIVASSEDLDRRLEGLNELRKQVVEDRGMYATRALHDRLQEDVSRIEKTVASIQVLEAKTEIHRQGSLKFGIAAVGTLLTILQISGTFLLYFLLHK